MLYCNFYNRKVFCRKKKLEKKNEKRKKKELRVLVARKALERTAGIGGEGFVGCLILYVLGVCCG